MKILFDTNVVVRAIYRPGGSAAKVLQRALAAGHLPVGSAFLLDEIERVLNDPRVKALAKNTEAEQQAVLEIFRSGFRRRCKRALHTRQAFCGTGRDGIFESERHSCID